MATHHPEGVTRLLKRWKIDGDEAAQAELYTLVERKLHQIAQQTLDSNAGFAHKIDPGELVNEAYLAIRQDYPIATDNRGPFIVLMRKVMRQHLLDLARRDRAAKRPPSRLRVTDVGVAEGVIGSSTFEIIEYYLALDNLEKLDERQALVIDLRVNGLTNEAIAEALNVALATVKRDVAAARAFLAFELGLSARWLRD
jgi:RNA polymerase sigma factor (TIGR02999 family)